MELNLQETGQSNLYTSPYQEQGTIKNAYSQDPWIDMFSRVEKLLSENNVSEVYGLITENPFSWDPAISGSRENLEKLNRTIETKVLEAYSRPDDGARDMLNQIQGYFHNYNANFDEITFRDASLYDTIRSDKAEAYAAEPEDKNQNNSWLDDAWLKLSKSYSGRGGMPSEGEMPEYPKHDSIDSIIKKIAEGDRSSNKTERKLPEADPVYETGSGYSIDSNDTAQGYEAPERSNLFQYLTPSYWRKKISSWNKGKAGTGLNYLLEDEGNHEGDDDPDNSGNNSGSNGGSDSYDAGNQGGDGSGSQGGNSSDSNNGDNSGNGGDDQEQGDQGSDDGAGGSNKNGVPGMQTGDRPTPRKSNWLRGTLFGLGFAAALYGATAVSLYKMTSYLPKEPTPAMIASSESRYAGQFENGACLDSKVINEHLSHAKLPKAWKSKDRMIPWAYASQLISPDKRTPENISKLLFSMQAYDKATHDYAKAKDTVFAPDSDTVCMKEKGPSFWKCLNPLNWSRIFNGDLTRNELSKGKDGLLDRFNLAYSKVADSIKIPASLKGMINPDYLKPCSAKAEEGGNKKAAAVEKLQPKTGQESTKAGQDQDTKISDEGWMPRFMGIGEVKTR